MTYPNPFSQHNPNLQIAWDATSLKALMECPRKYQYSILLGYRTEGQNVDTDFGGYFASSVEMFKKARLQGFSKDAATRYALRHVLTETWTDSGPWGGKYETLWRCSGSTPYQNSKGNRAKCPHSHKGVWYPEPAPDTCGECNSPCELQRQWVPSDRIKNRHTLVRLVAWYCDEQAERVDDGPVPYSFPNGTPAIELSFRMPLPWRAPHPATMKDGTKVHLTGGEHYLLCGHLDSIMSMGSEKFIADNKTTGKALNKQYFAQYQSNVQVETYDLAGATLYGALGIKGVMIEGAQILTEGARFGIGITYGSDARREEYLDDLRYWLGQAEKFAATNYWPKNRASCYLCQFKEICSKDPEQRQMYLDSNFVKRVWNPLEER